MSSETILSKIPILSSQNQYLDWSMEVEATAMMGGYYDPLINTDTTSLREASKIDKVNQRDVLRLSSGARVQGRRSNRAGGGVDWLCKDHFVRGLWGGFECVEES